MNATIICRICFENVENYLDIFENKSLNIVKLIEKHLNGLQIDSHDNYSTAICLECWNILTQFHDFYKKVDEIQQAHRAALENFNPKLLEAEVILEVSNEDDIDLEKLWKFSGEVKKEDYSLSDAENDANENLVHNNDSYRGSNALNSYPVAAIKTDVGCTIRKKRETKNKSTLDDEFVRKHVKLNCGECGEKVKDFIDLKQHFAELHGNKHRAYIRCCGRKFTPREGSYLKQHAYKQECAIEGFEKHKTMVKKEQLCTSDLENSDEILENCITKEDNDEYTDYAKSVLKETLTKIQEKTNQDIMDEELIRRHIKFDCGQCGENKRDFVELKQHFVEDHGNSQRAFIRCCGRKFTCYERSYLRQHALKHESLENTLIKKEEDDEGKSFVLDVKMEPPAVDGYPNENMEISDVRPVNWNLGLDNRPFIIKKLPHEEALLEPAESRIMKNPCDENDLVRKHIKFNCGDCGQSVEDFSELRKHFATYHGNKHRAYIRCCGRKFTCRERSYLKQHAYRHEYPDEIKKRRGQKASNDTQSDIDV